MLKVDVRISAFYIQLSSSGGLAQLGERFLCKEDVSGSSPLTSTTPCFLYILRSLKDGRLYTGIGKNVSERIHHHNRGGTPSTRHRRPLELLYVEEYPDRTSAANRERYLKSLEGGPEKHRIVGSLTAADIAAVQAKYL